MSLGYSMLNQEFYLFQKLPIYFRKSSVLIQLILQMQHFRSSSLTARHEMIDVQKEDLIFTADRRLYEACKSHFKKS